MTKYEYTPTSRIKEIRTSNGITTSYEYDSDGNILEKKENIANRILYMGQQYDQETGQYYLRARYYNPVIGRFTQEDTYRRDGLNLYAYCDNNPVMYYDPSGHIQEKYDDGYNAAGKTRSEEINDNNLNVNGKRQGIEGGSDTNVSADWGYAQNQSSVTGCQNIASRALEEGYSVIKVQSYRCDGINYIIYDNFEEILSPQMATPVKPSKEK